MADIRIVKAVVYRTRKGFRWRTVGGNGEPLAAGEEYSRKEDAIASVLAHIPEGIHVEQVLDEVVDDAWG